ncbi:MAG: shikimate dehydrogenase [Brachybacterium sp.]|nr:shikimate dehydrogenase [Brachybacterium sp.]
MGSIELTGSRRFAVVGSPVGHSLSPVLHRTAYTVLGITDAEYARHEVSAGALEGFLARGPGQELSGLSVTMPGKPEAFALAAETDATSRALGVANTLLRREDGSWRAENHDVHGIMAALRDHGARSGGSGAVLGSGATALSAVAALIELGVDTVLLCARSAEKLSVLEEFATRHGTEVQRVPWDRHHEVRGADCVGSARASDGAHAGAAQWRARPSLPQADVLLDVLYDPWPAPLAAVVRDAGGEVADGLEMLAHQADMQLRSMLGVPVAPVVQMLAAARRELGHGAAGRRP